MVSGTIAVCSAINAGQQIAPGHRSKLAVPKLPNGCTIRYQGRDATSVEVATACRHATNGRLSIIVAKRFANGTDVPNGLRVVHKQQLRRGLMDPLTATGKMIKSIDCYTLTCEQFKTLLKPWNHWSNSAPDDQMVLFRKGSDWDHWSNSAPDGLVHMKFDKWMWEDPEAPGKYVVEKKCGLTSNADVSVKTPTLQQDEWLDNRGKKLFGELCTCVPRQVKASGTLTRQSVKMTRPAAMEWLGTSLGVVSTKKMAPKKAAKRNVKRSVGVLQEMTVAMNAKKPAKRNAKRNAKKAAKGKCQEECQASEECNCTANFMSDLAFKEACGIV